MLYPEVELPRPISPAQCRSGRRLLGWSRFDLARESGVAAMAIAAAERGVRIPHLGTAEALRRALETGGIEFTEGRHPGVTLRDTNSDTGSGQPSRPATDR